MMMKLETIYVDCGVKNYMKDEVHLSYNSLPRSSHIWFSYIHNFANNVRN